MSYIGQAPTTTAFVTDQFSGTGSQTAFTMSLAPATTSSILVSVTGVLQDPSTYSVSGTTLTFSAAPPSGTGNISVRYLGIPASGVTTTAYRTVTEFTATAGQTSFSVPSYTVGYIDVYRNGARLGAADFTATSGTTVILTNPATAGDLVVTESFYVSSVLNAIPATAGAVNSTYITDAAVTQAKLAAGVAGNGPAFSVTNNGIQNLSNGTATKVALQTEIFDTANCFDNVTNYRFTPNVAGYYNVSGRIYTYLTATNRLAFYQATIYKNGSVYAQSNVNGTQTSASYADSTTNINTLMYLNGTTDYIELYCTIYDFTASGGGTIASGVQYTQFSASLVRAA